MIRKLFEASRPSTVNLGFAEPAPRIPPALLEAGIARFRESKVGYPPNAGIVPLRQKIVEYYRFPHARDPKNVVVTVGLQEALFAALIAVADPGDQLLVVDPAFPAYRTVGELVGLEVVSVPRDPSRGFALDPDAVRAAIGKRTRAVILNSPSNPTGRVDREDELRALVKVTEDAGLWLISDEIYAELYPDARPASLGALTERAVILGALSKTCSMTGMRLGYAIIPDVLVRALAAVHQFNVTCAPSLSQFVALEAFEKTEWLAVNRPFFRKQRAAMIAALDAKLPKPYAPPEAGMYVFVDTRSIPMPSQALAEELLEKADVLTIPGSAFGLGGEGWLRLAYGTMMDESGMAEGISRIAAHFRSRFG